MVLSSLQVMVAHRWSRKKKKGCFGKFMTSDISKVNVLYWQLDFPLNIQFSNTIRVFIWSRVYIYVYKTDDASQIIDARHVNTAQGSADRLSALLYSTPCTKGCGEYSSLNTEHSVFACIYAYSVQYVSVCVCVLCRDTYLHSRSDSVLCSALPVLPRKHM